MNRIARSKGLVLAMCLMIAAVFLIHKDSGRTDSYEPITLIITEVTESTYELHGYVDHKYVVIDNAGNSYTISKKYDIEIDAENDFYINKNKKELISKEDFASMNK